MNFIAPQILYDLALIFAGAVVGAFWAAGAAIIVMDNRS